MMSHGRRGSSVREPLEQLSGTVCSWKGRPPEASSCSLVLQVALLQMQGTNAFSSVLQGE